MSSFPTPDFGVVAEVYDEVRPADGHWREVFELLVAEAGLTQGRVLDVGCGTGRLVGGVAQGGAGGAGGDLSPRTLAVPRRKRPPSALPPGRADALPLP